MSKLIHNASGVREFFELLRDKIANGKSDAQTLARFVEEAINTDGIVAYERNDDGTLKTNDKGEWIPITHGAPNSHRGFSQSKEIVLAVIELYQNLNLQVNGKALDKVAMTEVKNIIRSATAILSTKWGFVSVKTDKTTFSVDAAGDLDDSAELIEGKFAPDGDYTRLIELIDKLEARLPAGIRNAKAA